MADEQAPRTSEVINLTIGRVTNEQMEQARAVWFKDEGDDGVERIGPVYLDVGAPNGEPSPYLIPFNKGEAEWFPFSVAEELARELGVEVVYS